LQLELELGGRQKAPRAVGHVHEVADPFDELADGVEPTRGRQRRRSDLDLEGAVARLTNADRFARAALGHLDERLDGGGLFQTIEPLDSSLNFGRQREVFLGRRARCKCRRTQ